MKKKKVRALLAEMMGWHVEEKDGADAYCDSDGNKILYVDCWRPDKDPRETLTCLDRWNKLEYHINIDNDGGTWNAQTADVYHTSASSFTKAVAVCLAKSWKKLKKEEE